MQQMLLRFACLTLLGILLFPLQSRAQVVISQVYGGGGNAGAIYTHDFIELFNRGTTSVSLAGWSVQYTSPTGTGNFGSSPTLITELPSVSLAPGQYFLIQEAPGTGGTTALPSPDLIDSTPIAMGATGGKVALVNTTTSLGCNGSSTACSPAALATIVDLVGYGNANFFEGTGPTPAPGNTTAALRASNGCTDTDNNTSDFAVGAPNPRNTSTSLNPCVPVDAAPSVTSTTPSNSAINVTLNTNITINFSEAVTVTSTWFTITGSSSMGHAATVTGGPTSFTLDPTTDFVNGETVTVTIFADNVSDIDTDDPPDKMTANFIFSFTTLASVVTSPVRINEIDSDTPGADALEFVELYDGGAGNTSLDGLVVVFYNGTNDLSYRAIDLDGFTTNAAGFFLIGNTGVVPAPSITFPNNTLQNGADAVALYFSNASEFPTNTPLTTTNLIDAIVYGTGGAGDPGLLVLLNSGQAQVNENSTGNSAIMSNARVPDGGTARNTDAYVQQMHTPGVANVIREIWQIQGSGLATPFANQFVGTANNVVTALRSDGFFMQTPTMPISRPDGDPQTSDGIFVFTGSAPIVIVGNFVNVFGQVIEFFDFTEYSNNPIVTPVSSNNPLPAPVQLDAFTPSPNQPQATTEFERFEGMRVEIMSGVVAGPNQFFASDNIAEVHIVAGPNRPFREPGIQFPGLPGLPVWDGNPEVFELDPDRLGQPNATIPAGSTFSATGVLGFEFSDYELWPTQYSVNAAILPRPVRVRNAGESTVATLNLHLLYDTINDPGGDDVATAVEYANKLNKLSLYIRTLLDAPDILAVQEAEKLGVLQDLANKINTDDAALTYTPYLVEGNDVGGIDVGFLVRNGVTVNSVTQLGKTDIFTFDGSLLHDRPPLLLDANLANGAAISVLCVHQRSLNGIDDPADGNRVRRKRHTQADSVARIVQRLQNNKPFINLVVTGDFNAFQFTDGYVDVLGQIMGTPSNASQALIPGTDVVNPDLTNKVLALPVAEQYSFNFGGSAQVLDHALVSQTLNPAITGVAYARGNSDAAVNFDNDGTTPLRASDHDGLVLYVTLIPVAADAGADREICSGQPTTLGGDPAGSGGSGPLTFNWMPTDGLDNPSAANPVASPLSTTTYTVTVTDANNSKATDQVTVTVNPQPVVEAGNDIAICVGQAVSIGGNPTGSGGSGTLTFSWTPTTGLSDPTSPNPKARPVVTTKYIVTVTDAKGCEAKDSLTVTVHDEVFLTNEYIHFHGPRSSKGNLHANGTINFDKGRPSFLKGNLMAVNNIIIRPDNTIYGHATAGKHISIIGNAKVTGAANVAPVAKVPLPVLAFIAGGKNITVGQNQSQTLAPGSYGQVKVLNGGKLFLASGEYFMSRLEMNASTLLTCDVTAGPITVNIVSNFKFGQKAQVVITPAGPMASAQVGFLAKTGASIEIGAQSLVRGAIIAPNAPVILQRDSQFKGSICAGKIDVHNGAKFFHHNSVSLTKESEISESEVEESEDASNQSPVTSYQLEQNYPNPFNPSTKIAFSVIEAGEVHLAIYNLQGQEVRTLVSGQMNPGRHVITWNGRDSAGRTLPSGVYLYKLRVNGFEETRKMTMMK